MTDLLQKALRGGYAVGYFEAWDQHSLEATMEAAEEMESPAIIGFGGAMVSQSWLDGGGLEQLVALSRCLAERSAVPAAVLVNEVNTFDQVLRGLRAGCNAVMLDSSHLPVPEHATLTRRVVAAAHQLGAAVEAELGQLADAGQSTTNPGVYTDPHEAACFVESTGVAAQAVSVGNVHMMGEGAASVDLDLLERIHQVVPVPLVIHGGSGFPASAVGPAIERGVAKVNVGTRLKGAILAAVREAVAGLPDPADPQVAIGSRKNGDILAFAKTRVKQEIMRFIALYGSAGRAATWRPDPVRADPRDRRAPHQHECSHDVRDAAGRQDPRSSRRSRSCHPLAGPSWDTRNPR